MAACNAGTNPDDILAGAKAYTKSKEPRYRKRLDEWLKLEGWKKPPGAETQFQSEIKQPQSWFRHDGPGAATEITRSIKWHVNQKPIYLLLSGQRTYQQQSIPLPEFKSFSRFVKLCDKMVEQLKHLIERLTCEICPGRGSLVPSREDFEISDEAKKTMAEAQAMWRHFSPEHLYTEDGDLESI